eukprot:scaffold1943_cov343-Pavlova_lutheri.AAC.2
MSTLAPPTQTTYMSLNLEWAIVGTKFVWAALDAERERIWTSSLHDGKQWCLSIVTAKISRKDNKRFCLATQAASTKCSITLTVKKTVSNYPVMVSSVAAVPSGFFVGDECQKNKVG